MPGMAKGKPSLHYMKHISLVTAKAVNITEGTAKGTGYTKDFVDTDRLERYYIICLVTTLIYTSFTGSWTGPVILTGDPGMGIAAVVCVHNQSSWWCEHPWCRWRQQAIAVPHPALQCLKDAQRFPDCYLPDPAPQI